MSHIYFDMDGVLADFDRGVSELCRMAPVEQGSGRRNDDLLWAEVRKVPHFYDQLKPVDGSLEMFRKLYREYGSGCEILTGIPKPYRGILTAGEDKISWVKRYLSADVVVHIVYREEKPQYCHGKEDILIDDFAKNIREWEEAGGTGVLFVTPEKTLEEVRKLRRREDSSASGPFCGK